MTDPFAFEDEPAPAAPPANPPYLDSLNDPQRAAIEALDGPVLVLAGAGTGKTRVLTTRLAHLLNTRRAWPSQIMAVTFTNKAAREMRERVAGLVGQPVEGWWLGTFHALAARILRRHAEVLGLESNFTILDTDDQIRLLKQVLAAHNVDSKRWPARQVLGVIQRWKDRGEGPDRLAADAGGEVAGGRLVAVYRDYQDRLRTLNAVDFGDLMLHNLTLFTTRPDILEEVQGRFRYLLVDEYQDTNVAQYLWLRLLAQQHRNICCVGDDDQSIYGWRGAEVGNILRFEHDFPGATVIRLEQNYRSGPHILAAAAGLIACNQDRHGKTLWTDSRKGDKVVVRGVWDGDDEARAVGETIEALIRERGFRAGEIAILVRAGFQTRAFEERFLTIGLPYRVIGGARFYERQEIRDALAYLRVIHQPADDLAFERIINVPKRGIGKTTLQTLHALARARDIPLFQATAELVASDELRPAARKALTGLLEDFGRWRAALGVMDHAELAETVLEESGYTDMWRADKTPEAPGRLENLKELIHALEEFDSLGGFLEHVGLVMDAGEGAEGDLVTLMTLHAAKGLEFDVVFLPGWEEGLFPHPRAMDENGVKGLEEERRLAYVGLTRARRLAIVSFAGSRRIHNMWQNSLPSRFVEELPDAHVERHLEGGMVGTPRAPVMDDWAVPPRPRRGTPPVIEGVARPVDRVPVGGFAVGARVFHQKFGYGTVAAAEAGKLTIDFDQAGQKKVMDRFVVDAAEAG